MSRNGIQLLAKCCLLLLLGSLIVACTNKMMPLSNPPEYQNTLVEDKLGRWHVVPIQCPILFDAYGHFEPGKNLGCSQVHNLALMVAHPEDLLGDTSSANIIAYTGRRPLIFRNQPLAIDAQKYYDDKLPKLQQQQNVAGGFGGNNGFIGTGTLP